MNEMDSKWRLRYDLITGLALLWVASAGRAASAKPEVHLYLADRYARLAHCHASRGAHTKAERLRSKADVHYRQAGPIGPPPAAALAMPVPQEPVWVDATGTDPDEPPGAA